MSAYKVNPIKVTKSKKNDKPSFALVKPIKRKVVKKEESDKPNFALVKPIKRKVVKKEESSKPSFTLVKPIKRKVVAESKVSLPPKKTITKKVIKKVIKSKESDKPSPPPKKPVRKNVSDFTKEEMQTYKEIRIAKKLERNLDAIEDVIKQTMYAKVPQMTLERVYNELNDEVLNNFLPEYEHDQMCLKNGTISYAYIPAFTSGAGLAIARDISKNLCGGVSVPTKGCMNSDHQDRYDVAVRKARKQGILNFDGDDDDDYNLSAYDDDSDFECECDEDEDDDGYEM